MNTLSLYLIVYLTESNMSVPQFAKKVELFPTQIYRLIKTEPNKPVKTNKLSNKRLVSFEKVSNGLGITMKDYIELYNENEAALEKLLMENFSLSMEEAMLLYKKSDLIDEKEVEEEITFPREVNDQKGKGYAFGKVKIVNFFELNKGYGNDDCDDPSILKSDQIIEEVLANDEQTYPEIYDQKGKNYKEYMAAIVGRDDGKMWKAFMIEHQDYCRYLVTETVPPKIVGDWQIVSLEKSIFDSILKADGETKYEGSLTIDDVRKMSSRSDREYDIFILNFSVTPLFSDDDAIERMEYSLIGALKEYVDKGVRIGRLLARPCNKKFRDVYQDDFGFTKVEGLEDVVNKKFPLYELDNIDDLFKRFPELED